MKPLARRGYRAAMRGAFAVLTAKQRLHRQGSQEARRVQRVLAIRLGLLGDGVLMTPALATLHRELPEAEIDVLATPIQVPVFETLPYVRRVITWDAGDLAEPRFALQPQAWSRAAALIRDIRTIRYDVVISGYGPLSSAIAWLSGAPFRAGYEDEALPGTLTRALHGGRYDRHWHDSVYSAALALATVYPERSMSELPWDRVQPPELVVPDAARQRVAQLLGGASHRLAVLHPGATNGEAKRWRVPHWGTLAQRLHASGWSLALVGASSDRRLAQEVAHASGVPLLDLIGRTTVPELFAVIERADVVVSGDSAPVHIAVALRRPVVAIHGPTDPVISGPGDASRSVVVRHPIPCSPCYRLGRVADCPLGHTLCQWLVSPEQVYAAVQEVMALAGNGAALAAT